MSRKFLTPVLLPADPTAALEAATKQYVDSKATPSAWTNLTLLNGCTAYGGGFAVPQYRKIGDVVELRGLVKVGASNFTAGTAFFTLGVGFRPPLMVRFAAVGYPVGATNDSFISLTVDTGGNCSCGAFNIAANQYVFLDTIRFSVS